ncbi:MAG: type II secretion system F family protein [Lentisphaeria bacterium]|nr:type II secretion system F family protein [Lentisphaeria bacterium]
MDTQSLIVSIIVFAAVCCIFWAFKSMIPKSTESNSNRVPALFRIFGGGIFLFSYGAGNTLKRMFPKQSEQIKDSIRKADIEIEVEDVYAAQIFFFLFAGIVGFLVMLTVPLSPVLQLLVAFIFALVGVLYPPVYISKLAEERVNEIMHHLPFAIDLISSSMNAGLDFSAAVRYLLTSGEEDCLRKEFKLFLHEVELGKTRTDALKDMQERINVTEFSRFVSAIAFGMDSGSSIIEIMKIQAAEMRRVKYTRAEQQAAKAPVKMIIPMALFILPSMFIIIVVPVILSVKDTALFSFIGK